MRLARRALASAAVVLAAAVLAAPPAFALQGDVTGDGVFDIRDALTFCRFLTGTLPTLPAPRNGDVNFDGLMNQADLDLMMQAVIGVPLPSAPLLVFPPSLDFGDVPVGDDATLDITLSNVGAGSISVDSIAPGAGTSGAFSIVAAPATPVVLGPGDMATVTVRYAPAAAGADTGSVVILSTGGDATVGLGGTGVSAALSVTPPSLAFGDLFVGDVVQRSATILNLGSADLLVNSIAPGPGTSPDFTLVLAPATPFTLGGGQQRQITVEYAPGEGGDDTGSIEILSTAGSAVVTLTGRGLAPALDVSPAALAFGNVLTGDSASQSFLVTNTGSAPLEVTGIALALGTSADFTLTPPQATPFTIAAGDSESVEVTYTPSGVGPDSGGVEVTTNAGDALVTLSGNGVTPDIQVTPASVAFGNVLLGQEAVQAVEIFNVGTADLTVSGIAIQAGGSAAITLRNLPAQPLVLAPGTSVVFDAAYQPASVGSDAATILITSDDPDSPSVQVPASGNGVSPALVVQPGTLSFSNVRAGQTQDLSFTITNSGTSDLTVNALGLDPNGSAEFSLVSPPSTPLTLGMGDSQAVTVRYAPAVAGADSGTVEIDTSGGAAQVTLSGNGVAPEIDLSPSPLPFGNVRVGQQLTLQVRVRNTGSLTLRVDGAVIGGADAPRFALAGAPVFPALVAAGDFLDLDVTYTPDQMKSDSAALTVTSDDDDEGISAVDLSGTGVAPVLAASPATLNFGTVTIGFPVSLPITLQNTGTGDLTIASVVAGAGTSAEFSVGAPASTTIGPGGSTTVQVTYTPADTGDDTGTVEITSDGGSASVALAGSGTVSVGVASLALSETGVTLAEGACLQVRALATLTNAAVVDVTDSATWLSQDPPTAAVGSTGLVTGQAAGDTSVSASYSGFTAQALVHVVVPGTLRIALPCGEVAAAATFEAEVTVDTGAQPLGAYAVRVNYDPAVVRITGIAGGSTGAFGAAPGANPSTFTSGTTLFAAYQDGSLTGPTGSVSVARVTFEVIGAAGAQGAVSLQAVTLAGTDLAAIPWTNVPGRVQVTP